MGEELLQPEVKIIIDPPVDNNLQEHGVSAKKLSPSILTRFHAGYFRITLACGAQILLWKTLSETKAMHFMPQTHSPRSIAFLLLWWLAFCTLIFLSTLYTLRCIFYFHLVKAEFLHHVGVNFLFTPWISWILLLQTVPYVGVKAVPCQVLWWIFVIPVMVLDLKIYGQWFTSEKRFLSTVANPTSQISVIGNLVGAWGAARMEWRETALFIFVLGMVHYLVVFITLYQHLSGTKRFPARLRPAFLLFVAAPSMASLAWSSVSGSCDMPCKMLFFLSLFLFTSLICRPTFFKKSIRKFNVVWWTYSFALTFLALASAEYAQQVKGVIASGLMLILSALSVFVFIGMLAFTAVNSGTLWRDKDPCLSFTSNVDRITV